MCCSAGWPEGEGNRYLCLCFWSTSSCQSQPHRWHSSSRRAGHKACGAKSSPKSLAGGLGRQMCLAASGAPPVLSCRARLGHHCQDRMFRRRPGGSPSVRLGLFVVLKRGGRDEVASAGNAVVLPVRRQVLIQFGPAAVQGGAVRALARSRRRRWRHVLITARRQQKATARSCAHRLVAQVTVENELGIVSRPAPWCWLLPATAAAGGSAPVCGAQGSHFAVVHALLLSHILPNLQRADCRFRRRRRCKPACMASLRPVCTPAAIATTLRECQTHLVYVPGPKLAAPRPLVYFCLPALAVRLFALSRRHGCSILCNNGSRRHRCGRQMSRKAQQATGATIAQRSVRP